MRNIFWIGLFLLSLLSMSSGCKKEGEKLPFQSVGKWPTTPLGNANEIDCELKLGHIFSLDGSSKDKGELNVLHARESDQSSGGSQPDGTVLRFVFTDLQTKRPRLKGFPYKKAEFSDLIILSNDAGGSVISFLIQKSTGGVIRTLSFIGEERPIADLFAGICRPVQ